jgi:hypothetical protein
MLMAVLMGLAKGFAAIYSTNKVLEEKSHEITSTGPSDPAHPSLDDEEMAAAERLHNSDE